MPSSLMLEEYSKIIDLISVSINKFSDKSILITGANGLVGSYIVEFLDYINSANKMNIKIYAMSRSKVKLEKRFENHPNVELIEQDLNKPFEQNISFDYIIHAASNSHPLAFSKDPVGTMKTNLIGTMNLLDIAYNSGAKFLYISTGEIYGNNLEHPFTEDDFGSVDSKIPRSCYPESKRAGETLCMSYSQQYGIRVNVARLCYIYGPTITDTNSRADAQFLRNALNHEDIVLKSKGLQRRTYCYVADAVSALLYIILNGNDNEVYNVANPNSIVSVSEYAKMLANIAGVNVKFEIPDEIEARGYSKQADSILNSSKLQSLGWKPFYDICEGLEHTIKLKKKVWHYVRRDKKKSL